MNRRDEDVATEMFVTGSHDYVMFFSTLGRVYKLKCYEIPEGSRNSRGMNIKNLLPLQPEEKISSMIRVTGFEEDKYLVMVTRNGVIKRTKLSAYDTARKGGLIAIDLDEGDALSWVRVTSGHDDLVVATKKGWAIRFHEEDIRELGRTARGVRAMKLEEGDCIVGMSILPGGRPGAHCDGDRLWPPLPRRELPCAKAGRQGPLKLPHRQVRRCGRHQGGGHGR